MRVFRALVGETGLRVAGPGQGSGGRRRVRAGARDAARRNSRSGTRDTTERETRARCLRHKDHRGPTALAFSRASSNYWCHSPPQAEEAWKDVSLYFSGEEWAAMGDGEKGRHRNRKRNFDVLFSRGSAQAPAGRAR